MLVAPRLCVRVPSAPIPPAASRAAVVSERTSCRRKRKVEGFVFSCIGNNSTMIFT